MACSKQKQAVSITYTKTRSLESLVSVHESAKNVMIINGERYENVRGARPFYLKIPELNSIVFVTDGPNYHVAYHIVSMATGTHVDVPAFSTDFGHYIGLDPKQDYIESVNGSIIVLCNAFTNSSRRGKERFTIDVKRGEVVAEETEFLDQRGNIIEVYKKPPPYWQTNGS